MFTYSKDIYLDEADARLVSMKQTPSKEVHDYPNRMTDSARSFLCVNSQQELVVKFQRGLRAEIRSLMRRYRRKFTRLNALRD